MSRIADHRIRAAVWLGEVTGTWYVDVYYAAHRTPGTSPFQRAEADHEPGTEAIEIEKEFADRVDALNYANHTVYVRRRTDAIVALMNVGTVTAAEALASLSLQEET